MNAIRPPAQAGKLYPRDAAALREALYASLAAAAQDAPPLPAPAPPKLLLLPCGELDCVGAIAAQGYSLLAPWRERIRRVVLLGPADGAPLRGLAAPGAAAFATPLGEVALDRAALATLDRLRPVVWSDEPHADNAALETQLPWLQAVLAPGFTLVPLAVGEAGAGEVATVLERLWGGDETVFIVSSTLSRDLPRDQAQASDRATVQRILQYADGIDSDDASAASALNGALLAARQHGLAPRLLALQTGGHGGESTCCPVVGHAALAFDPAPVAPAGFDDEVLRSLLDCARLGVAEGLGGTPPAAGAATAAPAAALRRPGASFVTLRDASGQALGSAGRLEGTRALAEDVRANARCAAATLGRRAAPGSSAREGLQLEIALLEPAVPLAVANEAEAAAALQPGRDGLILDWRGARVTLLPEAWQRHPQPAEFLAALKRQAGLPSDFWARDLRLSRYRAQRFSGAAS